MRSKQNYNHQTSPHLSERRQASFFYKVSSSPCLLDITLPASFRHKPRVDSMSNTWRFCIFLGICWQSKWSRHIKRTSKTTHCHLPWDGITTLFSSPDQGQVVPLLLCCHCWKGLWCIVFWVSLNSWCWGCSLKAIKPSKDGVILQLIQMKGRTTLLCLFFYKVSREWLRVNLPLVDCSSG